MRVDRVIQRSNRVNLKLYLRRGGGGAQRGILGAQRIDLRGEQLKIPRGRGVCLVPWPFDAASESAPVPKLVETLAEAPSASARCTAAKSPSSAASRRSVEVAAASGCAVDAMENTSLE